MKLCCECKYYSAGVKEDDDICLHEKAERSTIRMVKYHSCFAMLEGICHKNKLWEPKESIPMLRDEYPDKYDGLKADMVREKISTEPGEA